jgi:CRP-like cAMP-binding protein
VTIVEKLAANEVFSGASLSALVPVCNAGEVVEANPGETIIQEGQRNTWVYFVLDGQVEVYLPESLERISAIRLAKREAGSCLGEYAFVDQRPASAAVVATKPTKLFRISHDALKTLLEGHCALGRIVYQNLARKLSGRLRGSNAELDLFRPL